MIRVHHCPVDLEATWNLHVWQVAWDGNSVWDPTGTAVIESGWVDFPFPDVRDPRKVLFLYRSTLPKSGSEWEPNVYVRQLIMSDATEIWTFPRSSRVLYQNPFPPGVRLPAGTELTVHVITKSQFAHGRIYVWNPYAKEKTEEYFNETTRDDAAQVSTFRIALRDWMTQGFHLKLVAQDGKWEPENANRVWRPCDGTTLWLKSGQSDVRSQPLQPTQTVLEVLFPATLPAPPQLILNDESEGSSFPVPHEDLRSYEGGADFKVATYKPSIYPQAPYTIRASEEGAGTSGTPISRPYPQNPANPGEMSRFVLGASGWLGNFPPVGLVTLGIVPRTSAGFQEPLSVKLAIGNAAVYQSATADREPDGSFSARLVVLRDTTTRVELPAQEVKPYEWINTSRYFVPRVGQDQFFTTESVFGISTVRTVFAEPSNRRDLMAAAFGSNIVNRNVFADQEMPHGATMAADGTYFALHAPHAVSASVILVKEGQPATRQSFPMTLTRDARYWWCKLPKSDASAGARYHFVLNENLEVMDPAAREVQDRGDVNVSLDSDPNDPTTPWALVLDTESVRQEAHLRDPPKFFANS